MAGRDEDLSPEEKASKAAQKEIEKFQNEMRQKELQAQQEQNNRIITEYKQSITGVFKSDTDKYELSNLVGAQAEELAYDFATECVKLGLDAPSAQEAAEYVEQYYEDYFKGVMKSKKLTPQEAVAQAKEQIAELEEAKLEANSKPATKTLSNKATATVASTVTRKETPSEKRERLIRKLASGG